MGTEKKPAGPVPGVMEATSIEEFRILAAQSTRNLEAKKAQAKLPKQ